MRGEFCSMTASFKREANGRDSVQPGNKMKLLMFIIVQAFLRVSFQNPRTHWTLLPNILVLDVDGSLSQHRLSCLPEELVGREEKSPDIFWKKDGVKQVQRGNSYVVELEESIGGGNYTCYGEDGSLLNHTTVLIQEDETKARKILVKAHQDYVKCTAQNYNGEFHCSWTWHSSRAGEVAFIKAGRVLDDKNIDCSVDSSGKHWMCSSGQDNFNCSVEDSGDRISCQDRQYCPYAEERHQIHITVYVKTENLLETYTQQFYLLDIVKPDKVGKVRRVNSTAIEWTYPSSWNSPYSYFPLTFQIAQLRGECKKCENPCTDSKVSKNLTVDCTDFCQIKVKPKVKDVCVRAKDPFCNSQWSEWSHFRLERKKKSKKNKQRNKPQ
ncbi:interleukin 12Ba precursor isoform 2-T2 [Pholidichthys leucotaenia]